MANRYLHPGLATGVNDGTSEENAWQSWAAAIAGLASEFPSLITATTPVDVHVLGGRSVVSSEILFGTLSDSTYPLRFISSNPFAGVWDAAKPTLAYQWASGASALLINTSSTFVLFIGMQFELVASVGTSTTHNLIGKSTGAGQFRVLECGFEMTGVSAGTGGKRLLFNDSSTASQLLIQNCVFRNGVANGVTVRNTRANCTTRIENCTFVNHDSYIATSTVSANARVTNCLFVNAVTTISGLGTIAGTGKNASTDDALTAPLPGADNTNDALVTFDSETYLLAAANALGAGPDDATYGAFVPTTDILGNARTGEIASVGAHEPGQVAAEPKDIFPVNEMISGRATTDGGN